MAAQRSTDERMRIARECLKIEKAGGDVLAYLLTENYYTPRATWYNLQREFLRRKPYECKDGKPKKGERGVNNMALTNEQKLKAAEIAIDGGDPRVFLEECGLTAPEKTWWYLKQWLKKNYPEMADKLPKKLGTADDYRKVKVDKGLPKDEAPAVKVDGPLRIETPEANKVEIVEVPEKPKITKPLMHSGKKVIGLQGDFGTYFFKEKFGIIDFDGNDSEEVSYTIDEWRNWMKEIRVVFQLMGVEL